MKPYSQHEEFTGTTDLKDKQNRHCKQKGKMLKRSLEIRYISLLRDKINMKTQQQKLEQKN